MLFSPLPLLIQKLQLAFIPLVLLGKTFKWTQNKFRFFPFTHLFNSDFICFSKTKYLASIQKNIMCSNLEELCFLAQVQKKLIFAQQTSREPVAYTFL